MLCRRDDGDRAGLAFADFIVSDEQAGGRVATVAERLEIAPVTRLHPLLRGVGIGEEAIRAHGQPPGRWLLAFNENQIRCTRRAQDRRRLQRPSRRQRAVARTHATPERAIVEIITPWIVLVDDVDAERIITDEHVIVTGIVVGPSSRYQTANAEQRSARSNPNSVQAAPGS